MQKISKKENIIKLLIILGEKESWNLARPLAKLIYSMNEDNEELYDLVLLMINNAINDTKDIVKKEELEKTKKIILDLKKQELKEREEEELLLEKKILEI